MKARGLGRPSAAQKPKDEPGPAPTRRLWPVRMWSTRRSMRTRDHLCSQRGARAAASTREGTEERRQEGQVSESVTEPNVIVDGSPPVIRMTRSLEIRRLCSSKRRPSTCRSPTRVGGLDPYSGDEASFRGGMGVHLWCRTTIRANVHPARSHERPETQISILSASRHSTSAKSRPELAVHRCSATRTRTWNT